MEIKELKFTWDKWQQEVLDYDGNITLRTGRQVGKSEVISQKAVQFAMRHEGTTTMVIAASQRQSSLLFEKIRDNIELLGDETEESLFAYNPTLTKIVLKNGSRIYCMPAGKTGHYIRGFTIDLLIADEAAYIPEMVWNAVIPMIAVSAKTRGYGWIILLSTPFGKGGYFYDSFTDKDFKAWHVSSENCLRIPKKLLDKERRRMTKAEYRQEYQGEFTDEWNQFFPTKLILERMNFIEWNREEDHMFFSDYYLGVDFAGYGGDENAFVICELTKGKLKIVKCMANERRPAPQTIQQIEDLHKLYNFKKIFVDDGGLGSPITDLLKQKLGKRIIMGLNNSSKRIEEQGNEKKQGIFKEDLYANTLLLMETGRLDIIADPDLQRSMKCITFNHTEHRKIKIFGTYTHLTEALVRACWCIREKGLRLYVY